MSRIRIIALMLAAFAISAPPALASSLCTKDKCTECEVIYQDCLVKANGDGVKVAKCQADLEKCKSKCTL